MLRRTKALKLYVCNLVTRHGQTEGFTVSDHVTEIERFAGGPFLDYVFYNEQKPIKSVEKKYHEEGAYLTVVDRKVLDGQSYRAIGGNFLGEMAVRKKSEHLQRRSLIRHDADGVVKAIMRLYNKERKS